MKGLLRRNAGWVWIWGLALFWGNGSFGQLFTTTTGTMGGPRVSLFSSAPARQLAPGKQEGTFAFSYSGHVEFTEESAFPVRVEIEDMNRKALAQMEVKDGSGFELLSDLLPGSYDVFSKVNASGSKVYEDASGGRFFIDRAGMVTFMPGPASIIHQKNVSIISPRPDDTVTEARPLLKWESLKEAVSYEVWWTGKGVDDKPERSESGRSGNITNTEYRLQDDVPPKRRYQWHVEAYGAGNKPVGNSYYAYFFTPGGRELIKDDFIRPPVKAGSSYLGIMTTPNFGNLPGIGVLEVSANSPALKAGVLPGDVLTSFNGHSLKDVPVADFVRLVEEVQPGTKTTVELERQGVTKSMEVTIEARP